MPTLAADSVAVIALDLVLNSSTALASDTPALSVTWVTAAAYGNV